MIRGNAVIGQSGGPTSVINASLFAVIEEVAKSHTIEAIYGMHYGIEGLINEWLIDFNKQPQDVLTKLKNTPSSALGSSRYALSDNEFPKVLEVLKKFNIRYMFQIGGNGSMYALNQLEVYCREHNYELCVIGIPKTVDNDLCLTDHAPGYPSAARSNALNVLQAGVLARDMKRVDKFMVYQTIGRDTGWLAAATATALARKGSDDAPHLIYIPEIPFEREKFLQDVKEIEQRHGWVSVVVSEGLRYADGTLVSAAADTTDFTSTEFGATAGASAGLNVHRMIHQEFGWRGEFQITESLIMSDHIRRAPFDVEEAYQCGLKAVKLAEAGDSGNMVIMRRLADEPYTVEYVKSPLLEVAKGTKSMPRNYMNEAGNFPSQEFINYAKPLIGELPEYVRLKPEYIEA
ncbi:MAG: diphosphate--fructose-6-phosphate 1-phosphotransferase [Cyclobacteriaceae bacterium]